MRVFSGKMRRPFRVAEERASVYFVHSGDDSEALGGAAFFVAAFSYLLPQTSERCMRIFLMASRAGQALTKKTSP